MPFPALTTGCKAYLDCFGGLIPCVVCAISGRSHVATSSIKVTIEITKTGRGYQQGERLTRSSLWVIPREAIRYSSYSARIGHYTVGDPA